MNASDAYEAHREHAARIARALAELGEAVLAEQAFLATPDLPAFDRALPALPPAVIAITDDEATAEWLCAAEIAGLVTA
jgi:hypothetical protein